MANNIDKIQVGSTNYDITPSSEGTFSGVSNDSTTPHSWTDVDTLVSGETNGSIFTKISSMFKNIRYLYNLIGTSDFSGIDTTITGALTTLNNEKSSSSHTHSTFTSAASGFVPAAVSGSSSLATSGYVLTGNGWKAGTAYNTDTTYNTFTSASAGLVAAARSGSTSLATSGYVLTGVGWKAGTAYNANTTYAIMGAATSSSAGTSGLVPAPAAGQQSSFLRGNRTWSKPEETFKIVRKDSASTSIPAGGFKDIDYTVTLSGYIPYGMIQIAKAGAGSGYVVIAAYYLINNNGSYTLRVSCVNTGTVTATVVIAASVFYIPA